jgi:hypothetical protein
VGTNETISKREKDKKIAAGCRSFLKFGSRRPFILRQTEMLIYQFTVFFAVCS